MHVRLISLVGLALGAALVLAGCGTEPEPEEPTGTAAPTELDETRTIEPLDSVEGAERVVVDGVGIDVPEGAVARETVLSDEATQLVVTSEGQERADAIVTVSRVDGAGDGDVFVGLRTTRAQIDPAALHSVVEFGAEWSDFPYAVGMAGEIDTGEGEFREFIYVTSRDDAGTRLISVSAEAPEGAIEDSRGYEILRTVRVDGS